MFIWKFNESLVDLQWPFHYLPKSTNQLAILLIGCWIANQNLTDDCISIIGKFQHMSRWFQCWHALQYYSAESIGSRLNISFFYIHFIYSPWPFVFVVYTFTFLNLKNTVYLIIRKWEQSKHIGLCDLENPGQVLQNVIWRSCFHVNINTIILLSIFPVETVATR